MIYRKRGRVTRWEHGRVIHVEESGVASEQGELFACHPDGNPHLELPPEEPKTPAALLKMTLPEGVGLERLVAVHGVAAHQYGDRTWQDETQRLHVSLTRGTLRVLIDRGDFEAEEVRRIAEALARASTVERDPPPRLRLAPNVAAACLPGLVGLAPPNVRLLQTAGGVDGNGSEIVEADGGWPNWYRPSYRLRPVRMPLNLRLECSVTTIDRDRPVAVALLAPVRGTILQVLVDDGGLVYPATVRITRIDAVAGERTWYPYGGGSFGAEMML